MIWGNLRAVSCLHCLLSDMSEGEGDGEGVGASEVVWSRSDS